MKNVIRKVESYSLRTLMLRCSDFADEKLGMEHLFMQVSWRAELTVLMLIFPKYHCKVTGERIGFVWGVLKYHFWSFPLKEKDVKEKFNKCVREGIEGYIKKEYVTKRFLVYVVSRVYDDTPKACQ